MAFSNVSLLNTFAEWMALTNQLVVFNNNVLEGYFNKTLGTIELSNSGFANSNVTLNVSNGYIKGNGIGITGLLNTAINGVFTNSQLQNNSISVSSNNVALVIDVGTGVLGTTNVSINLSSNSTVTNLHSNVLATAAAVNTAHSLQQTNNTEIRAIVSTITSASAAAFGHANAAFANANSAGVVAVAALTGVNANAAILVSAFGQANTARDRGNVAFTLATDSGTQANTARDRGNVAFTLASDSGTQANVARIHANAAFLAANNANNGDNKSFINVAVTGLLSAPTPPITVANTQVSTTAWVVAYLANSGLASGNSVQTFSQELTGIAAISPSSANDRLIYATGAFTYNTTPFTALARTLLDDTTTSSMRTTLELGTAAVMVGPSGTIVGTTDVQNLTNKILFSPTLTGTPIGPTAAANTNTTQLATTAFVLQEAVKANVDTTIKSLINVSRSTSVTALDYMRWQPTDYAPGAPAMVLRKNATVDRWDWVLTDGVDSEGLMAFIVSTVAAGNTVGIGTLAPTSNLHVIGTSNITSALTVATMNVVPTIQGAYGSGNTGQTIGSAAFGQANTARTHANSAFAVANNKLDLTTGGSVAGQTIFLGGTTGSPAVIIRDANTNWGPAFVGRAAAGSFNTGVIVDDTVIYYSANNTAGASKGLVIGPHSTYTFSYRQNAQSNTHTFTGGVFVGGQNVETTLLGAFAQANTGVGYAQAAYAQANTARDRGNVAFTLATDSGTQANVARVHANAAYAIANVGPVAFAQANAAYTQANAAYTVANTANAAVITSGKAIALSLVFR